jgi:hypothetical protein
MGIASTFQRALLAVLGQTRAIGDPVSAGDCDEEISAQMVSKRVLRGFHDARHRGARANTVEIAGDERG